MSEAIGMFRAKKGSLYKEMVAVEKMLKWVNKNSSVITVMLSYAAFVANAKVLFVFLNKAFGIPVLIANYKPVISEITGIFFVALLMLHVAMQWYQKKPFLMSTVVHTVCATIIWAPIAIVLGQSIEMNYYKFIWDNPVIVWIYGAFFVALISMWRLWFYNDKPLKEEPHRFNQSAVIVGLMMLTAYELLFYGLKYINILVYGVFIKYIGPYRFQDIIAFYGPWLIAFLVLGAAGIGVMAMIYKEKSERKRILNCGLRYGYGFAVLFWLLVDGWILAMESDFFQILFKPDNWERRFGQSFGALNMFVVLCMIPLIYTVFKQRDDSDKYGVAEAKEACKVSKNITSQRQRTLLKSLVISMTLTISGLYYYYDQYCMEAPKYGERIVICKSPLTNLYGLKSLYSNKWGEEALAKRWLLLPRYQSLEEASLTPYVVNQSNIKTFHYDSKKAGEGLYIAKDSESGLVGYIDMYGKTVITPQYQNASFFSEGLAIIEMMEGERKKYGYIDGRGKLVVEPFYDYAKPFHNGYGCVKKDNGYGFVNGSGEEVVPINDTWCEVSDFIEVSEGEYVATVRETSIYGGKTGVVDTKGNYVIAPVYDELYHYDGSQFNVEQDDAFGRLDINTGQYISLKEWDKESEESRP